MVSFRWKLLLSFYLLTVWYCLPIGSQAQYNTHYDRRKFNLGFTMGVNFADVRIKADDLNYADKKNDGLKDLTVHITPGINLGMITNTKLAKHWDLRFIPSVSLQQRNFDYKFRDSTQQRKLEASYLDLPLHVKFKSDFYKNHRVYLLAGGKFSINLASDKKVRDNPNLLKINRTDWSADFGFGIDIYGDRVKLAPEIRYSYGFVNIYIPDNTAYGNVIKRLTSHSILLSLMFE